MIAGAWARDEPEGTSLLVRVIARAGRTAIAGVRDGRLLVRLAAPPVEGAANEALIALFARRLRIPASNVLVISGAHARNKKVAVLGMAAAQCRLALGVEPTSLPSARS